MGYILDPYCSFFLHPGMLQHAGNGAISGIQKDGAGAWYRAVLIGAGGPGNFSIKLPVPHIFQSSETQKGSYIRSIDVWYKIEDSSATFDVYLYVAALPADGAAHSAAAVTFTYDSAHDLNEERIHSGEHKMTITPASLFWMTNPYIYYLQLDLTNYFDAGSSRYLYLYGARLNMDLRL